MAGSPFTMKFRHLLQFSRRDVSSSWERHIIANADPHKGRGEWVKCNAKLDGLFAKAPGRCAMKDFNITDDVGRIPCVIRSAESNSAILVHGLSMPHGDQPRAQDFEGIVSDYERTVIHARLRGGYGVEDIHVMDGLALDLIRAEISQLTRRGTLRRVLGLRGNAA
ncbi:hypothetical protein AN189_17525 [Loktanella sp. 3ANDIMAR09]|nr:hypothetical protein AN189_17525 [Loktanella sp. 3ANDIMAR09]